MPWWFLLAAIVAVALLLIARRRMSKAATESGRLTGVTVVPRAAAHVPSAGTYWTGGANVPFALGRISASWPLAQLRLTGVGLTLRLRPALLTNALGTPELTAVPGDSTRIYPVRSRLGSHGVGLHRAGELRISSGVFDSAMPSSALLWRPGSQSKQTSGEPGSGDTRSTSSVRRD